MGRWRGICRWNAQPRLTCKQKKIFFNCTIIILSYILGLSVQPWTFGGCLETIQHLTFRVGVTLTTNPQHMQGGQASVTRGLWVGCGGGGGVSLPAGLPWPCLSPKVARLDWMFPSAWFSCCAPVWKISSSWRRAQDPRLLFMSQCLCCPAGQTQPSKQAFRFDCRTGLKAQINYQSRRES